MDGGGQLWSGAAGKAPGGVDANGVAAVARPSGTCTRCRPCSRTATGHGEIVSSSPPPLDSRRPVAKRIVTGAVVGRETAVNNGQSRCPTDNQTCCLSAVIGRDEAAGPSMACKRSEVCPGCQQSASNCASCSLAWPVRASEVSTVDLRRHGEEVGSSVGRETEARPSHAEVTGSIPVTPTSTNRFVSPLRVSCARDSLAKWARESRISSAVLVQMNGLGSSFQWLIQARMSASRAWTLVDPAADQLVGEEAEPALDLVDPRGAGRGEVHVEPGVRGQPARIAGVLWVP